MQKFFLLALAVPFFGLSAMENVPTLIGPNTHFAWDEGIVTETVSLIKQAGFNANRDGINRRFWEPDRTGKPVNFTGFPSVKQHGGDKLPYKRVGLYGLNETAKADFHTVWCLLGTSWENEGVFPCDDATRKDFANYCKSVVEATKNKVLYYQIWNEWDGAHEMHGKFAGKTNTAENYVELLKTVAPVIRSVSPNAKILANSFCMGDKMLFEAFEKGMLQHCDAYALHPYAVKNTPEFVYHRLLNVSRMSAKYNNGKAKPFVITEMGWNNVYNGVSEATAGDYLARLYLLLKAVPGFKGMTWYNFNERIYKFNIDNGSQWGITMPDMTPKDAYYTMKSVAPIVKDGTFVKELPIPGGAKGKVLLFKMKDGTYTLAAWSTLTDTRLQLILYKHGGWNQPVIYERCGATPVKRTWAFRNQTLDGNFCGVPVDRNKFSFHTASRPVLLYNVPADVKLVMGKEHNRSMVSDNAAVLVPQYGGIISRAPRTIDLTKPRFYRKFYGNWNGPADHAVKLTCHYDDKNIYVKLDVTDDKIILAADDVMFWKNADSCQLGLSAFINGKPIRRFRQYTLYPFKDGSPHYYCWNSAKKKIPTGAKFSFKVTSPTTYTAEYTVPFSDIAAELGEPVNAKRFEAGGAALGFTVHVSDCDGAELKGGFHWGNGVTEGNRTSPAMYGQLFFVP
ncbi:MAG: hypothetical protein IJW17_08850 [Lentisphaeria bacterium]|nr:hypothetical protein [Lentisphaeria bacterium]